MENSFLSLLYPSTLGVKFTPNDLLQIRKLKSEASADEIFELLEGDTKENLIRVNWKTLWLKMLESRTFDSLQFVSLLCSDYPAQLRLLSEPPLLLSYVGKPIWQNKLISVVGSRKPTEESLRWMSYNLPSILNSCQLSVVSGGARGVDQWAHRLSIQTGRSTLCVVPAGLSCLYPESLKDMATEIISSGGALLSSYALHQEMRKFFFHERNLLIAAFGEVSLIVEAGLKSGSLVTARQAADLGKDVMTLPFSPWFGAGAGSNRLVQEGALLVVDERDVCEYFFKFRSPEISSIHRE